MRENILRQTIRKLLVKGKGILAADESVETIGKRFAAVGIYNDEEMREAYRELLFTSPGIQDYISGVILFDETLRQNTLSGMPLRKLLEWDGIVVGCKVDQGLRDIPGHHGEMVTKGLEGLAGRLEEYYELGVRFAKWRAVFSIDAGKPSDYCIRKNAGEFAIYAKLCQSVGIVPIVEPEVLSDGRHTMEDCFEVTSRVLKTVFQELKNERVNLHSILLKPNMIVPGQLSHEKIDPKIVANLTVSCLVNSVPTSVPGIVFLSGGQSESEACANLNEIAAYHHLPWKVTFSFGRALQNSTIREWRGESQRSRLAQYIFLKRAKLASLSAKAEYNKKLEQDFEPVRFDRVK